MGRIRTIVITTALFSTMLGCTTAAQHQQSLHSAQEREMTVGVVQKEIRQGMSQADVAGALGSPNIVTKDGAAQRCPVKELHVARPT